MEGNTSLLTGLLLNTFELLVKVEAILGLTQVCLFEGTLTSEKPANNGEVTAGLSGISNEMWKHCNKFVLVFLLCLLNLYLAYEFVPDVWKEVWVSMILKPYE
ncbi:hypothetical protein G9A89_001466 [Geosiphon pyriformis]|nr:hypothetical protein G9A89_001466 [Geosiphon pyriformis]